MVNNLDPDCKTLSVLHKKYISGTDKDAIVLEKTMFLCNITHAVRIGLSLTQYKVYITSRVVKHLYDKKPASTYDLMLRSLHQVVKYPQHVYQNKQGKRGDFIFIKEFGNTKLMVSIEGIHDENELYVVTSFPTGENYLRNCTLIWSWRGGIPSS